MAVQPSSRSPRSTTGLVPFVAAALGIGIPLMTLSTIVEPAAPFLLAAILFALGLPALALTYRDSGGAGVRALLRDCVRLPTSWWWLLLAGFGLPVISWTVAVALGGAQSMTWGLIWFYVFDLITGALIINIWEEMAWTGFFQRRASSRWGVVGGSLVTTAFFTAIHGPLSFDGPGGAERVATNLLLVAGLATGIRLLIARLDGWCGGSLLTIGILHSSFNATETILEPAHDWVRIVCTIAAGIAVVAFGRQRTGPASLPAGSARGALG